MNNNYPTQVGHPWRTTLRSIIQFVVPLATAVPLIVDAVQAGNPGASGPIAAAALAVSGAITRVMAIPQVNDLLTRIGLGAYPKEPK